jgi:hypothetical protein
MLLRAMDCRIKPTAVRFDGDRHRRDGTRPISPETVIAGLDPAIQENLMNAVNSACRLDCRVEPGNEQRRRKHRAELGDICRFILPGA